MSISKHFLIEQISRLIAIDKDENSIYNEDKETDIFWKTHNIGHIDTLILFRDFISNNNYVKKDLRKWLKRESKISKIEMKKLDKKYNNFDNDEQMDKFDNYYYAYFSGVECVIHSLISLINGKNYYDKKSYEPTDWSNY